MICSLDLESPHHFHAHWIPLHIHSQLQVPVFLFWWPALQLPEPKLMPLGTT